MGKSKKKETSKHVLFYIMIVLENIYNAFKWLYWRNYRGYPQNSISTIELIDLWTQNY